MLQSATGQLVRQAKHPVPESPLWLTYSGEDGPGKGKHIVLIAADQEYRSEYALPMLAKILAKHHGFDCTVLFSVNKDNEVDPTMKIRWEDKTVTHNIPGLEYLDKADLGRKNTLPIYTEQLSLLVPDTPAFQNRKTITWKEAAQLPLAMLRPSMHERRFVDQVFASVGAEPVARVESESILHLMFQVQFTELCTIIPSHFVHAPGLHRGTRALALVDPIVSQEVGLFWTEGEIVLPMANAFVSIVRKLNKSGELRKRLEGDHATVYDGPARKRKSANAPVTYA